MPKIDIKTEREKCIRAMGESLIENASSIAGDEKFIYGLDIHCSIVPGEPVEIEISRRFCPERLVSVKNKFDA